MRKGDGIRTAVDLNQLIERPGIVIVRIEAGDQVRQAVEFDRCP